MGTHSNCAAYIFLFRRLLIDRAIGRRAGTSAEVSIQFSLRYPTFLITSPNREVSSTDRAAFKCNLNLTGRYDVRSLLRHCSLIFGKRWKRDEFIAENNTFFQLELIMQTFALSFTLGQTYFFTNDRFEPNRWDTNCMKKSSGRFMRTDFNVSERGHCVVKCQRARGRCAGNSERRRRATD